MTAPQEAMASRTAGDRPAARPGGGLRQTLDGPAAAWASTVVRLALASVWAWAGLAKISDPAAAAQAVRAYRILPESMVKPVGYGLPFLELALALLLVVGLGTRIAAGLSGVLLLVFIAGISSVWARGLTIDCGCFGGGGQVAASQTRYLQEILRDTGFLLLAAWLVWRPRSRFSTDGWLAA